jgi:ribonucleoside-diphosphate reductase alpha subunit
MLHNELVQLCSGLDRVDIAKVSQKIEQLGILDTARVLGYQVEDYQNLELAGRLLMKYQQSVAPKSMTEYVECFGHLINNDFKQFILKHAEQLQQEIDKYQHNDYDCDWFSAATEQRTYLWAPRYGEHPRETVQHQHMRVSIQLYHKDGLEAVLQCYRTLSEGWGTHASPTIFNAGRLQAQMSSCFLFSIGDSLGDGGDSILYRGVYEAGMISKANGGLGFDVSRVRHSEIAGTGTSAGLIPMLMVYNSVVRYVDQGGRRKGAATIYCRPHHIDIEEFVTIVDKVGDQYARAHDINTAIWTPWLFWQRVREDGDWTLVCPAKAPELNDVWGLEFEEKYIAMEKNTSIPSAYKRTIKARHLLKLICNMQQKTGMPYIMHADACNLKSNHRHLGYIRSGNLCLEVIEYSSEDEIPSCNLASLSVRKFIRCPYTQTPQHLSPHERLTIAVSFEQLAKVTRQFVRNLNRVIDNNWYPLDKKSKKTGLSKAGPIRKSNQRHRPIGLGASGFAEAVHQLDLCFAKSGQPDPVTRIFNKMFFACVYFNALAESIQLSITEGCYESFQGSPFSEGKLQFDLWKEEMKIRGPSRFCTESDNEPLEPNSWSQEEVPLYNKDGVIFDTIAPTWDSIKEKLVKYGARNSLLTTLMPTATTAQKLRNGEACEAHTSNLYSRKVMNGGYPVINRYMVEDLRNIGCWNKDTYEFLKASNGSIKGLSQFLMQNGVDFDQERMQHIQNKYLTMWEISQRVMLTLTADRARYIDQSQSTNIYIADPTEEQLTALHLTTDEMRLKTGMYYLRREPPVGAVKFTTDPTITAYLDAEGENKFIDTSPVESPSPTPIEVIPSKGPIHIGETIVSKNICHIIRSDDGEVYKTCCS